LTESHRALPFPLRPDRNSGTEPQRTARLTPIIAASVCVFISLIAVGMIVGRVIGRGHPALVPLQACTVPCWGAIIPGETSLSDAQTAVEALGYLPRLDYGSQTLRFDDAATGCAVDIAYNFARVVYAVDLRGCANLTLGDLILLWGQPSYDGVYLAFNDGHSQAILFESEDNSPRAAVHRLHLTALYDVNDVTVEDLHL